MHKLIFFGTGDFAVPSLRALARDGRFEIAGVVTQPDRPIGRHALLTPPPIKVTAQELGIPNVIQPEKIADASFREWIERVGPACAAFIVVSYGKILPQWLLDLPQRGAINVHGSLLPRWRGASPIQAAIAAGDAHSGISIMLLDADLDHGPVLAASRIPIGPSDIGASLHDRLADLGAALLPDTLNEYLENRISPVQQNHAQATFCKTLSRDDGRLDWSKPALEIERKIRAYHPWPGTWTFMAGKRLKIARASVIAGDDSFEPGKCFIFDHKPAIACGQGTALLLNNLQLEGREAADGETFLRGHATWNDLRFA